MCRHGCEIKEGVDTEKTHLNFYYALSLVTETEVVSLNQEAGSFKVSAATRCKLMR